MSEVPQTQKKQYLLMVDEVGMAMLSRFSPSFAFVQVEGMPLENNPGYQVLVNPRPVPPPSPVDHNSEANKMVEEPVKDASA